MRLLITGSPGTGKSLIAQKLGQMLKAKVVNEKDLALREGIGQWNHEENELEIPLGKLKKACVKELKKSKNVILEGHILCELKLNVDAVIVLRADPELLQERLSRRYKNMEKVFDNVFIEGIDYCKKYAFRNYGKKAFEARNEKGIKDTLSNILKELKERGVM